MFIYYGLKLTRGKFVILVQVLTFSGRILTASLTSARDFSLLNFLKYLYQTFSGCKQVAIAFIKVDIMSLMFWLFERIAFYLSEVSHCIICEFL